MLTECIVYNFHVDRTLPDFDAVWVFGSNKLGRHGLGAAKVAQDKFGAIRCVGVGRMDRCYAIPTKSTPWQTMTLQEIRPHIEVFKSYARARPYETFWITRVGCGEAGYRDEQVAPLFLDSPPNCNFAEQWRRYLGN